MDTILFDMDGTLLDTLEDLHVSVNYALERSGLPRVTFDETREAAGYGSIVLIELLTKHAFVTGSPEFQRVFDDFNGHYKEHCNDVTHPYPGVMELLAALKERGLKMAIVSNKVQPETEALRELWFADFIPVAVGRVDGIAPKPDPAMANKALELLGSQPQDAWFVGDSQPDVRTGKNAGCTSIGCTWGFRDYATLEEERPDFIIDDPLELLDIIDAAR
ncbi:MAG: HAD family hydrolase [Coriobacteriales bacterium]